MDTKFKTTEKAKKEEVRVKDERGRQFQGDHRAGQPFPRELEVNALQDKGLWAEIGPLQRTA